MNDDASAEKNPARPGEYGPFSTPSPRSSDFGVRVALPTIPDHELFRPIGEGSYGEVWLARNKLGTLRAVKIVYRRTFEDARPFEREFRGIQKFEPISRSHEGLVDLLQVGRNEQEGYFYYVMEHAWQIKDLGLKLLIGDQEWDAFRENEHFKKLLKTVGHKTQWPPE